MTEKELENLRNGLKKSKGARGRIAKEVGVTTEMVRLVLLGRRRNLKILAAAAKEYKRIAQGESQLKRQAQRNYEEALAIAG